jgi:hypothetical protein
MHIYHDRNVTEVTDRNGISVMIRKAGAVPEALG